MNPILETKNPHLAESLEAIFGQIRSLRERLEVIPEASGSTESLANRLKSIESAAAGQTPAAAARNVVSWAIDIIDALSNARPHLSRPAYLAASRLSAALLMISQFDSSDGDGMIREALDEAMHEVAAQCLILELGHSIEALEPGLVPVRA